MGLKLVSVYDQPFVTVALFLYDLLAERTKEQSISHKAMPAYDDHARFILSDPYMDWSVILVDGVGPVGAVYLTRQREIGIGILKQYQGNGYGSRAVKALMASQSGQVLANINPQNAASIAMFAKLGFTHIQNTYAHE